MIGDVFVVQQAGGVCLNDWQTLHDYGSAVQHNVLHRLWQEHVEDACSYAIKVPLVLAETVSEWSTFFTRTCRTFSLVLLCASWYAYCRAWDCSWGTTFRFIKNQYLTTAGMELLHKEAHTKHRLVHRYQSMHRKVYIYIDKLAPKGGTAAVPL